MKAVVLTSTAPIEQSPLRVEEVADPTPDLDEIVIRVTACGVCRSNLHMIEGDWVDAGNPAKLPIIPGHEVVGEVVEIGSAVTSVRVGQRVGVQPLWSTCGVCDFCLDGRDELCQRKHITGETVDGGYAELMLAKAAHAYVLPDELDDVTAAPLFCPGITAYGAVAKAALSPAKSVAVFGLGGVGHVALQFAALTGAETIAVTRDAGRLDLASGLGAARVVNSADQDAGEALAEAGGVDAALVFAPSDAVVQQAVRAVKPGGTVVVGVNATLGAFPFADEKTIVGSLLGNRVMMRNVLRIAAQGRIRVVADSYPLTEAATALAKLKSGDVRGRLVLQP